MTLTRFDGDRHLVVAASHGGPAPLGQRIPFEPDTLPDRVRRGARVTRVDDYSRERDVGLAVRFGLTAAVAVPIHVGGGVWGMLTATSGTGPLPPGTEDRLQQFTELVGAALANVQARAEVQALAEEQAALRRLAELAAREAPIPEVLDALAREASWLAGVDFGMVLRFEPDGVTVIEALAGAPETFAVGMRASGSGDGSAWRVWRTGRAARADDLGSMSGRWPQLAHRSGFTSSVAAPVRIDDSLWGALVVVTRHGALPGAMEEHLSNFSELAGTVLAAAQNKAKLAASRARVVATADETRRRVQRDVHDSAQQRLVHTIVTLKLARQAMTAGRDPAALVDEALRNAERAEPRPARRRPRHPSGGTDPRRPGRGAGVPRRGPALTVGSRVAAPRLPPALETTAYFVVAEALTNVVKHAHATRGRDRGHARRGRLVLEVRDDGDGGADPARGTGLTGLLDRVEAGDGTLTPHQPGRGGHDGARRAARLLRGPARRPRLTEAGCGVVVPYLRGRGPTRFLDGATPRSGQQAALGGDVVALLDALGIDRAVLAGYGHGRDVRRCPLHRAEASPPGPTRLGTTSPGRRPRPSQRPSWRRARWLCRRPTKPGPSLGE